MIRLAILRISTLPIGTLAPFRSGPAVEAAAAILRVEADLGAGRESLEEALHAAAGGKPDEGDADRARARLAVIALKRSVHNGRPLRDEAIASATPLLPPGVEGRLRAHEGLRSGRASGLEAFRRAFDEDLDRARRELLERTASPLVREGIRLASRSLLSRLRALGGRAPRDWGHDERHVGAKGLAYLARFCTKTSPNGLFCATALAGIGGGELSIEGSPRIDRVDVIFNIFEAGKITSCLGAVPEVEAAIVPRPNSTLREEAGAWTFWKFASSRNPTEEETLCRVKENPILRLFIEEAGRGGLGAPALIDAVAARCDVDRADLGGFYQGLVTRGILVAEIEVPYNERRPLRFLSGACRASSCAPAWLPEIERIESEVDRLPAIDSSARIEAMDRIGESMERLPHTRPLTQDELFRLDAASALKVGLPDRVLGDLHESMSLYARLFAAMYPASNYERIFTRSFLAKHPADTDVNFLELYRGFVDPKEGDRPAAFPDPSRTAPPGSDVARAAAVLKGIRDLLIEAARDHDERAGDGRGRPSSEGGAGAEVEITGGFVQSLLGDAPEPRWSGGVLFQIAAPDPGAIRDGRYRLVLSSVFNGAGLAQSRFAHLHGGGASSGMNPIVRELRRAWACVEHEGALVAEISYNHHARTSNAGLRPSIFTHEIEMPGEKASPGATVIALKDLAVRYDSAAARFVMTWIPKGAEVIPVITSGVNPVGITSFMVTAGYQGIQPVGYFPGFDVEGIKHWPRVRCGPLVLFREQWVFRQEDWPASPAPGDPSPDASFFLGAARWRARHRLPRHVFVHTSEEPKPRYVDLEAPLFVDLLRRSVAALAGNSSGTLHVSEMYPGPEDLWIGDERGRFATEFLVQIQGPAGARAD